VPNPQGSESPVPGRLTHPASPGPATVPSATPPGPLPSRLAGPVTRLVRYLWVQHRLMTVVVALSLVPRVLAALAFRPALFIPDSFGYLASAIHPAPGAWHPFGYPVLLWFLLPFHSLLLVTTVQHLMGIVTAVIGYAVLRYWRLPAGGAVLAACPTLFDSRQVALESLIAPDVLYALLIMIAVAILLTRRGPTPARCALAGLALAGASVTRGNGAPEMVALLAVLAVQRASWRAVTAAISAFAVPVLGYMGLFATRFGDFALTNSDGMFLWSRTMSFANCAAIKPPPDLRPLCPQDQPHHPTHPAKPWSLPALLNPRTPADYLWAPGAWWRHDAQPGFTAANNDLARQFALDAITAQPLDYLRTVGSGVLLTFLATDRSLNPRTLHFTPVPDVPRLYRAQRRHLSEYGHTTSDTHPVQPFAYFLYLYQEPVYFPGIVFGLVVIAGLAGVARNWRWRRGGPPALPWAVAVVGIVTPVAVHMYHYRYVLPVVPVACLAAGLAFARRPAARRAGGGALAVPSRAVPAPGPAASPPPAHPPAPGPAPARSPASGPAPAHSPASGTAAAPSPGSGAPPAHRMVPRPSPPAEAVPAAE
jgi:hypothetical protein